jgi:hypothetical protein
VEARGGCEKRGEKDRRIPSFAIVRRDFFPSVGKSPTPRGRWSTESQHCAVALRLRAVFSEQRRTPMPAYWQGLLSCDLLTMPVKLDAKEMHRQVGDLVINEKGLAERGLLVRHLVMPNGVSDTTQVMRFLAQDVSPHT